MASGCSWCRPTSERHPRSSPASRRRPPPAGRGPGSRRARASRGRSGRDPPWAAGSMRTAPPAEKSRLPDQRSPWIRAGGRSSSKAPEASRSHTCVDDARPRRPSRWPASTARRTKGRTRCSAKKRPHVGVGSLGWGWRPIQASPLQPGGGAPKAARPGGMGAGEGTTQRLGRPAVGPAGLDAGSRSMWSGATSCTATTEAPPAASASASQRRPAASASKKPAGAPGQDLRWTAGGARHGHHRSARPDPCVRDPCAVAPSCRIPARPALLRTPRPVARLHATVRGRR